MRKVCLLGNVIFFLVRDRTGYMRARNKKNKAYLTIALCRNKVEILLSPTQFVLVVRRNKNGYRDDK